MLRNAWATITTSALILSAGGPMSSGGSAVVALGADVGTQPSKQAASARFDPSLVRGPVAPVLVSSTGPPPNLVIPSSYRSLVQAMWDRSPTFRRQCDRIAAVPRLTVTVTLHAQAAPSIRGVTTIRRSEELLEAQIDLRHFASVVEMLAHELEHVVEQLDGVDIEARARHARADVTRTHLGFETERAIEVGRQVAREVALAPGVTP
jgi:hypothetical protein